ncbi:cyclase-like protein 2 [Lycium barbarum]|uniref:cyclase-like protein 2 n=1 Tax=Lycium barbarum TaxID=112863 RepID=UPI00293EFC99|nr:cyclase-like protein 2 [Lycium barbarum]
MGSNRDTQKGQSATSRRRLNSELGPALLVDVPRDKNLTADVMQSLHIPKGVKRVLFRTLNTDRSICIFFSLLSYHDQVVTGMEIILVEGLKLDDIEAGIYTVHCLPLRLLGAEGSPIRCILIK